MSDVIRILVLLFGGVVVGLGAPILFDRARMWTRLGYPKSALAAYLLLGVNVLVMAFVAFTLTDQYGSPLSWRTPVAFVIFVAKGWLLSTLRWSTFELRDALPRAAVPSRRHSD